jgi:transcriptional regulator with XRE-family HTH domain
MLGERLKKLRKEQNITQKELGEQFNLSSRVIGYYESEERTPTPDFLLDISNYFNISLDYLLGKTDKRNPENSNYNDISLTDEELNHIKLYRKLNDRDKAKFEGMMELKISEYNSKKEKSSTYQIDLNEDIG